MKKLLLILFTISCSISLFARSVNEVKQILIGEWYEENHDKPGWEKYNADGTGSFMVSAFLFEESLGDFSWSLSDENTLICVLPNNKISRESISIIDNNTILLNGKKYIRRGTKETTNANTTKPSQKHTQSGNSVNRNPQNATSNPIVAKHVNSADDFIEMYKNLIGLPFDFRDSNIEDIKSYCKSNNFNFTDKGYYIQVSNPITKVFGQEFEVRIHERDVTINNVGKPSKMYLEWYSKPYNSSEKMNSDFKKFTDKIEQSGGIFQGYDETCHRSIYQFSNGIEIRTKAWDNWNRIQMFVYLP